MCLSRVLCSCNQEVFVALLVLMIVRPFEVTQFHFFPSTSPPPVLQVLNPEVRNLEVFIALLVMVIACCFFIEMGHAPVDGMAVLEGMFVPRIQDLGALAIAISLIGALVMPHNLFLHSALVLSRKPQRTSQGIKDGCLYSLLEVAAALIISFAISVAVICDGCLYSLLEVAAALIISFAINVAVICVGGAVCSAPDLSPDVQASCSDISLSNAYFLLRDVLGAWASTLFGIALLASGQSSTITGTYAGQYVMSGFLELHLASWLRNLLTRLVAIVPSLAVAIVAGATGAGNLIIASSIILSFGLPYALIPLLKFTSSPVKMGPFTNHPTVTVAAYIIGTVVIFVNCVLVVQACVEYLVSDNLPQTAQIPLGIAIALVLVIYVVSLALLARRPVTEVTYISANEGSSAELDAYMSSPPHDFARSGGDGDEDGKGEVEGGGEECREEGGDDTGEGGSIEMTNVVLDREGGVEEVDEEGGRVETREGLKEELLEAGHMDSSSLAQKNVTRLPYLLRTLYGDMLMDGVQPNFVTFPCGHHGSACAPTAWHDLVFFFNQDAQPAASRPIANIFNCVMTAYSRSGHVERVFRVDWDMRAAGRPPNIRTYHALLTACTTTGRFDKSALLGRTARARALPRARWSRALHGLVGHVRCQSGSLVLVPAGTGLEGNEGVQWVPECIGLCALEGNALCAVEGNAVQLPVLQARWPYSWSGACSAARPPSPAAGTAVSCPWHAAVASAYCSQERRRGECIGGGGCACMKHGFLICC
ncbi:unnamed protein product [Closterium sp. Naga37s-1]|nr:unnamed protein product [Closterium sp. Naga37s-1]